MDNTAENITPVLISVIMPAYNAAPFIEEAVRSVMTQTVSEWELLVLDDGSRDDTCTVVERLAAEDCRIRLLRNETNMGVAKTRNRGFSLCKGQYVALLDSDDVWHPQKLERQLAQLRASGADLAYCSYGIIDANGEKAKADYLVPAKTDFRKLLKENVIGCSTVMLCADIIKKYRFETNLHHEDYALWLRLTHDGFRAVGCTDVLVNWRYIQNSRSFDKRKSAHSRWVIYREYMKLPLHQSAWAFANYAVASIKKYFMS